MTDRAPGRARCAETWWKSRSWSRIYAVTSDPGGSVQRVVVRPRSGNRGSAFTAKSTRTTLLATPRRYAEYRASQGIDGPLLPGRRHARAVRAAQVSARWRASRLTKVSVLVDARGWVHADAGGVRSDPGLTMDLQAADGRAPREDGIGSPRRTNRPADGGFKYQPRPTAGQPAPTSTRRSGPGERTDRRG